MKNQLSFFFNFAWTSVRSSLAQKNALLDAIFLLCNNLLFLFLWWLFFERFSFLGLWSFQEMMELIALSTGAYGTVLVFLGGIKKLPFLITQREMSPFLLRPQHPLLLIAGSCSYPKGWGHLAIPVLLLALGKISLALFLYIPLTALVFASFEITLYSALFWWKNKDKEIQKIYEIFLLFSLYPANIYTGLLQAITLSFIPAGFASFFPIELLRHFSFSYFALFLGGVGIWICLTTVVFSYGLKKIGSYATS